MAAKRKRKKTEVRNQVLCGDVREKLKSLLEKSVQMCVTSPPYWGLRDYGVEGQLGLEPTPELFIENLVEIFGLMRRPLRDDGTFWLNIGDSYFGDSPTRKTSAEAFSETWDKSQTRSRGGKRRSAARCNGLKPKDLCQVPQRLAVALQADGWYLRSAIIWAKGTSFCPEYIGSVMPESVNGWRWERHRIRQEGSDSNFRQKDRDDLKDLRKSNNDADRRAVMSGANPIPSVLVDCPGCKECRSHKGYILRKGSWRPTSGYEMLYMFTKTAEYFCDAEAVRETATTGSSGSLFYTGKTLDHQLGRTSTKERIESRARNLRNVWLINPKPYKEAHFATFPTTLIEPIVKAATSEKGQCSKCGAPWVRKMKFSGGTIGQSWHSHENDLGRGQRVEGEMLSSISDGSYQRITQGWLPSCTCKNAKILPQIVLDPFFGSGTTGLVAENLKRDYIGIDLKEEYCEMARKRIQKQITDRKRVKQRRRRIIRRKKR